MLGVALLGLALAIIYYKQGSHQSSDHHDDPDTNKGGYENAIGEYED